MNKILSTIIADDDIVDEFWSYPPNRLCPLIDEKELAETFEDSITMVKERLDTIAQLLTEMVLKGATHNEVTIVLGHLIGVSEVIYPDTDDQFDAIKKKYSDIFDSWRYEEISKERRSE